MGFFKVVCFSGKKKGGGGIPFEIMAILHGKQSLFLRDILISIYPHITWKKFRCNIYEAKMPKFWKALNENGKYFGKRGGK